MLNVSARFGHLSFKEWRQSSVSSRLALMNETDRLKVSSSSLAHEFRLSAGSDQSNAASPATDAFII